MSIDREKFEKELLEVAESFKGKGGDPEAESIVVDHNMEKKDGFVSVWSNKVDANKIITRCIKDIIDYEVMGTGVSLKIDRKAFRGVHCAFRSTK